MWDSVKQRVGQWFWPFAVGVAVVMIGGPMAGLMMYSGTAQTKIDAARYNAQVAGATASCVYRFQSQPGLPVAWQALKKSQESYDQTIFLQKKGANFVSLPGLELPSDVMSDAASSCARLVLAHEPGKQAAK